MKHIKQVPPDDCVVVTDEVTSGHCHVVRLENKDAAGMKDVIEKIMSPRQTFIGPCACTFATSKACTFLNTQRRFPGREIDTVYFKQSILQIVEGLEKEILNDKSNILVEAPVRDTAKGSGVWYWRYQRYMENYYPMPRAGCVLPITVLLTSYTSTPTASEITA